MAVNLTARSAHRARVILAAFARPQTSSNQAARCLCVLAVNNTGILHDKAHQDVILCQQRNFMPNILNPFSDKKPRKRLEYSERRLLGYSMEQMFDVVSRVDLYKEFVPWCKQSTVSKTKHGHFNCKLTVGFPPITEQYTSLVTVSRPHLVKAVSKDGRLFNYLLNEWQFLPGISDNPNTCTLAFTVSFEFRSALHSHLAQMFFDEVVRTMVKSFLKRAESMYGPQSIKPTKKKVLLYET